jgi:protein TonB
MNRLQKKCVIATASFHLLMLVILFVGPAFFWSREKPESPVADLISPDAIESVINNGSQHATPPPPAPIVTPPPQPAPPVPQPVVVAPAPVPKPTIVDRVEKFFTPEPPKPAPAPVVQPQTPKVDLHVVTRPVPKTTATNPKPNPQAMKNIADDLRQRLSPPTDISTPGDSTVAQANYASIVKSVYDRAWGTLPDNITGENENVKVSITIASNGTVINARIITSSGDAALDASVQRTLERVTFVAPFLKGMTEKEWTHTISFNPETKRMSE